MSFDYQIIGDLLGDLASVAIPIGVILYLAETLVSMFFRFAFPKHFRNFD